MATTYKAEATRDGKWWAITVPEVRGVFSQAKRLDQVEAMAIEAIALMLDVDEADVAVEVVPRVDHEARFLLDDLADLKISSKAAAADAEAATKATAQALHDDGFTMRDIGALLGITFQRVHQLVTDDPPSCPVCGAPGVWRAPIKIKRRSIYDSPDVPSREVPIFTAGCSAVADHWRYDGPAVEDTEYETVDSITED